jgi:hypothetical protein
MKVNNFPSKLLP